MKNRGLGGLTHGHSLCCAHSDMGSPAAQAIVLAPAGRQPVPTTKLAMASIERVGGGIAARRAALTTVVEVDELHVRGEGRKCWLQAGVIAAGATMNEEGNRPLVHRGAIGHQPRPFDVEVDFGITNLRAHTWPSRLLQHGTEQTTSPESGKV
jgi:hypothetical protein